MTKRFGFMLLALLAAPAIADDTDADEVPDVRRYTVEMIIFRYAQDVSVGTEVFVSDEPPGLEATDLERLPESTQPAGEDHRVFVLLLEEDFTLSDTFARMQRLDVYEPLMHFGWTQSTLPEEETKVRPLSSFAVPPAGLDGDLTLYLGRYLHLAVNLQLDAETKPRRATPRERRLNVFGDEIIESLPERITRFRLAENRIVRNGELRYFDHPKFGVLAKVSRVEVSDDELDENPGASGDDELLGDIPQQVR